MSKTNYTPVFLNKTIHSYKEDQTVVLILSFLMFPHHISDVHHLLPASTVSVSELTDWMGQGSLESGREVVDESLMSTLLGVAYVKKKGFEFCFWMPFWFPEILSLAMKGQVGR